MARLEETAWRRALISPASLLSVLRFCCPGGPLLRSDSDERFSEEGPAVPRRGPGHRARAGARAAVADRDDAARRLPHGARAAPAPDPRARRARRRAPQRARPGRQSADRRRSASWRASSARRWRSARRRSTCCAAPAARRRCSRTPRTPARPRPWRSPPTRRSSAWPAPSATTRRPSWPRRSAPTRRRCSTASCARSPSSPTPWSRAEVKGNPSYDVTKTGAADAVREAGEAATRRRARPAAGQAHRPPGPQGPGRRPGRGPDQGRRRVRGRPGDRALRQAHRRGDHRQARRAVADRPRQDRLLRAQEPEPRHRPRAASPRCAATSRGPATTS